MERRTIAFGIGIAAALAIVVERLIVTDEEAIETVVNVATAAAERGDWDSVAKAFDDEIVAGAKSKSELIEWIRDIARRQKPTSISTRVLDVKFDGDRARARVHATGGSAVGPWGASANLDFIKREFGWRITGVSEAELGTPFR